MALTFPQAKVLGVLAAAPRTFADILAHTGLSARTIRTTVHTLAYRDLARPGGTHWRITARGRLLIGRPVFRDFRIDNIGRR